MTRLYCKKCRVTSNVGDSMWPHMTRFKLHDACLEITTRSLLTLNVQAALTQWKDSKGAEFKYLASCTALLN